MVSLARIVSDLKLFGRGYLRNKIGLFFSLVFPIILILLFGSIFSGGGGGPIPIYVQNRDSGGQVGAQFVTALNSTGTLQPTLVDNTVDLKQYLLDHSSSEGILIPQEFSQNYYTNSSVTVTIYSNSADTSSGIVRAVVDGVVFKFNLNRSGAKTVIDTQAFPVTSQSAKYIDFLVPGLIGFTVLTSPMFSLVNISSEYKKSKFFKQLSLTPLTKTEWLTSKFIWYTFLSLLS